MAQAQTAAFFRVEGTLIDRGALAASAYFASNAQGMAERAFRIGAVALGAPIYGFLAQNDKTLATRAAYVALRHMSEDRILELAEEYYTDILSDRIYDRGKELVVSRIAKEVGAEDFVCNRLEFQNGECTGKLLDPVIGGHDSAKWVRTFASERGFDLTRSVAYAAHGADLLLLSAVGKPCAVNPDFALRGAARDADWPVLEYR